MKPAQIQQPRRRPPTNHIPPCTAPAPPEASSSTYHIMSRKPVKVDLANFARPDTSLPSAPSGLVSDRKYENRYSSGDQQQQQQQHRGGGFRDRTGGDSTRRDDFRGEDVIREPSAADESSQWRREAGAPAPMMRRGDGERPSRFERTERGGHDGERVDKEPSPADESSQWRRSGPPPVPLAPVSVLTPAVEREPSAADESSQWRRSGPLPPPTAAAVTPIAILTRASEPQDWRSAKSSAAAPQQPAPARQKLKLEPRKNRLVHARDTRVTTAFGPGTVTAFRPEDSMYAVALDFGATGFIRGEEVMLAPSKPVKATQPKTSSTPSKPTAAAAAAAPVPVSPPSQQPPTTTEDDFVVVTSANTKRTAPPSTTTAAAPSSNKRTTNSKTTSNHRTTNNTTTTTTTPPTPDQTVSTPYGPGTLVRIRPEDGMNEITLEFGARAFLRQQDVTGQNPKPSGSRRFGDHESDREREKAFRRTPSPQAFVPAQPVAGSRFAGLTQSKTPEARFQAFGGNVDSATTTTTSASSTRPPKATDTASDQQQQPVSERFQAFNKSSRAPPQVTAGPTSTSSESTTYKSFHMGNRPNADSAQPPLAKPESFNAFSRTSTKREEQPIISREEREKRFSAFNVGSTRNRDDGGDNRRAPFPSSFGTSGGPTSMRERGGGGGDGELFESRRRVGGGPRDDSERRAPLPDRALPTVSRNWSNDEEEDHQQNNTNVVAAVAAPAPSPSPPPVTSSTKPKKGSAPSPVTVVTPARIEDVIVRARKLLDDYFTAEDKAGAIQAFKSMGAETSYHATFMSDLMEQGLSTAKLRKLVVGLVLELIKHKLVDVDAVAQGLVLTFGIVNGKDAQEAKVEKDGLKDLHKMLEEKVNNLTQVLEGDVFDENEQKARLFFRGVVVAVTDEATIDNATPPPVQDAMSIATELVKSLSSLDADSLVKKAVECNFDAVPDAPIALLKALLGDKQVISEPSRPVKRMSKLLKKLLLAAPVKVQVQSIEAIQDAFNTAGFPKAANGDSLLSKVFMLLFETDVLPGEAFLAWKDNVSSSTPGRETALAQTTSFIQFLEAGDDDGGEE